MKNILDTSYTNWLIELKTKLRSAQSKAALAVNSLLIEFYWDLGKSIAEKENIWGSKLIEQVAKDLQAAFPEMKGLSSSNLKYCKRFYVFYQSQFSQQAVDQIGQQPVVQIPWGHNILIFSKSKTIKEASFYISETIENGWSRDALALQIKTQLYQRQGKAITNFKHTLPNPLSDLVQQTLKDPYVFDFLTLSKPFHERDIENQLIAHITKFLLELGKGFAFVGKQHHLEIGETDYYIDLLFYHIKLKCYVVIELKNTKFIPEYAGKLNFYLSAVDSLLKQEDDKPTIGMLLCRDKNNIETEFALRDINKPMGVSEFQLTEIVPDELKSSLPSIEEIENELKKIG
jgi:predicted nuclease of restriction endonuclease-like (RecB) superfamily